MSTAGGTAQVIRKRADEMELIMALKSIKRNEPVRHETSGTVYPLGEQIGNMHAFVKIIDVKKQGDVKVRTERRWLHNVQQLLGCARTRDTKYYYLIMPYKGIPYSQTRGLSPEKAKEFMFLAVDYYEQRYCLKHL